ncbi:hypothetical protein [Hahella sp. HN01]|uniref:hypothetical protein n=1 Tax=Hahella sp. HN01 TaxID=2847262 RepID=UPI001C1E9D8F|nr:hypothetical protein [Hahella sp. HN01]MBU6953420.1 hypothetical protein [Hahella sp. HN01]
MAFDSNKLKSLYDELSSQSGMRVIEFQISLESLFGQIRSIQDIYDYRLGRKPWKKLRDEVMPVSRFLKFTNIKADYVQFPLNNKVPDCWLLFKDGSKRGIEVTLERGKERFYLADELNEVGEAPGFMGVQDDAPEVEFEQKRRAAERNMYSTDQALDAFKKGISRCFKKKGDEKKYKNIFYLILDADLEVLPRNKWDVIKADLSMMAVNLPFKEVYVINNSSENIFGIHIK